MTRSVQRAQQLGTEEDELRRLARWFETNTGWIVNVSGVEGQLTSFPYPTVEAAIVGALSIPPLLWRSDRKGVHRR